MIWFDMPKTAPELDSYTGLVRLDHLNYSEIYHQTN